MGVCASKKNNIIVYGNKINEKEDIQNKIDVTYNNFNYLNILKKNINANKLSENILNLNYLLHSFDLIQKSNKKYFNVELPKIEIPSDDNSFISFYIFINNEYTVTSPWTWKFIIDDKRLNNYDWGKNITDPLFNDRFRCHGTTYEIKNITHLNKFIDILLINKCSNAIFLNEFKILLENDYSYIYIKN